VGDGALVAVDVVVGAVDFDVHVADHVAQGAHDVGLDLLEGLLLLAAVLELVFAVGDVGAQFVGVVSQVLFLGLDGLLLLPQLLLHVRDLFGQRHVFGFQVLELAEQTVVLVLDVAQFKGELLEALGVLLDVLVQFGLLLEDLELLAHVVFVLLGLACVVFHVFEFLLEVLGGSFLLVILFALLLDFVLNVAVDSEHEVLLLVLLHEIFEVVE